MFDPARREARAYALGEDGHRQVVLARGSDAFEAPPFSDLAIPLSEIWRY